MVLELGINSKPDQRMQCLLLKKDLENRSFIKSQVKDEHTKTSIIYMIFVDIVLHLFLKIRHLFLMLTFWYLSDIQARLLSKGKQKPKTHKTGGRLSLKTFPGLHCVSRIVYFWIVTFERFLQIWKWLKYFLRQV